MEACLLVNNLIRWAYHRVRSDIRIIIILIFIYIIYMYCLILIYIYIMMKRHDRGPKADSDVNAYLDSMDH